MPFDNKDGVYSWRYRSRREDINNFLKLLVVMIIFLVAANYIVENTMWIFVADAPQQAGDFISRMFPPDFNYLNKILPALWDTFNIAVFGTILGMLISIPVAIFAAQNTTPNKIIRAIALIVIVASRSINSLIWALLLVQLVGPGLFAGVLAIGIRSIGMISKLFYEAIEEINPVPIEAIKATGASRAQVFLYGYVPQLMPVFVGVSVYRWEINIRESTIIGIVGGGGLGFVLNSAINRLAWDQVVVVLFTILVTVLLSEIISAKIRPAVS